MKKGLIAKIQKITRKPANIPFGNNSSNKAIYYQERRARARSVQSIRNHFGDRKVSLSALNATAKRHK